MADTLPTTPAPIEPGRMLVLPKDLSLAVAGALAAVPATRWLRAAEQLSERYRTPGVDHQNEPARSADEWLGYAAMLLPATYAQLRGALAATAARIPAWSPSSLLDLGSGPGTALWAATAQWPALRSLQAWEREPEAIALGRALARGSETTAVRGARWERVDLRTHMTDRAGASSVPRSDLVVLGHALNEFDGEARADVINLAWNLTGGVLLIVEPGTPEGFAVVRGARDALLSAGAQTIAPCAHDRPCPLENDWCHFPQRLKRPDFQRRARGAPSEWEDSKFAYVALARFPATAPIWGRVIREPFHNKAYAEVQISSVEGVAHYRGLKRSRDAFRLVKDLPWGAALDEPPPASITREE